MKHITIPVKGNAINIFPIADSQYGSPGFDTRGFKDYVKEIAQDSYGHVLGVGDYVDGISPSNRSHLQAAFVKGELYDMPRQMLDASANTQVKEFLSLIDPTKTKWDAVLGGHHFWEFTPKEGRLWNSDNLVANYVNAPYVENQSTVVVTYVFKGGSTFTTWATHGSGGTSTFSGPLNQLEKMMRAFTADAYIVAHHHKLVAARAVKLTENPNTPSRLLATDSVLVGAGSWLKGYLLDEVTYAERDLYVPLATGAPVVRVERKGSGVFKIRVEL